MVCPAQPPEPQHRPAITGSPSVGEVLTVDDGMWVGSGCMANWPNNSYDYQWYQEPSTPIGTNSDSYTVQSSDTGHVLYAVVTAINDGGSTDQRSVSTDTIGGSGSVQPASGFARPGGGSWTLLFEDHFDGALNDPPDGTYWSIYGGPGTNPWGQNSTNCYSTNVWQDGSSHCVLQLVNSNSGAMIRTDPTAGTTKASVGVPIPVGAYVEFYMYIPGADTTHPYNWVGPWIVGSITPNDWPSAGEIDVIECNNNAVSSNFHGPIACLSSALSTGGPITSLPVHPLTQACAAQTLKLQSLNFAQSQNWVTTGASLGATSLPVTSQTPSFAFPSESPILNSAANNTNHYVNNSGTISGAWCNAYHAFGAYRGGPAGAGNNKIFWDTVNVRNYNTNDDGNDEYLALDVTNTPSGTQAFGASSYVRVWI